MNINEKHKRYYLPSELDEFKAKYPVGTVCTSGYHGGSPRFRIVGYDTYVLDRNDTINDNLPDEWLLLKVEWLDGFEPNDTDERKQTIWNGFVGSMTNHIHMVHWQTSDTEEN